MAAYQNLIAAIQAVIKRNGNEQITGNILQQTLVGMVNSIGANYQLAGLATPETDPGTPDQNIFYFATEAGTYTNFDEIVVPDDTLALLLWSGTWSMVTISLPQGGGGTVTDVTVDGTSVVDSQGVAEITMPTIPVTDVEVNGTSVVSQGVASVSVPTTDQTYSPSSTNPQSGTAVNEAITAILGSVYTPGGSIAFADRPTPSASYLGYVYDITDAFTTDNTFVEGAGLSFPAGTDIVVINTGTTASPVYMWDVLGGFVDLSNYYTKSQTDSKIATDIAGKEDAMVITAGSGTTLTAQVGRYYRFTSVGTLAITLPTISGATKVEGITFSLATGSTPSVTFAGAGSETIRYQNSYSIDADALHEVTALWNGSEWTITSIQYIVS